MAALKMEASALAKVPLSGTNHTVGVDDFHKIYKWEKKRKIKKRLKIVKVN